MSGGFSGLPLRSPLPEPFLFGGPTEAGMWPWDDDWEDDLDDKELRHELPG